MVASFESLEKVKVCPKCSRTTQALAPAASALRPAKLGIKN
jgi:hypothetical protein